LYNPLKKEKSCENSEKTQKNYKSQKYITGGERDTEELPQHNGSSWGWGKRKFRKNSYSDFRLTDDNAYDCFRIMWLNDQCPECHTFNECSEIAARIVSRKALGYNFIKEHKISRDMLLFKGDKNE